MFCRKLRSALAVRCLLGGFLCLALLGSVAASTPSLSGGGEVAVLGLRAPEFPLAALGALFAVRFQKQAQPVRLTLQKPERSGQLSSAERAYAISSRPNFSQGFPALPRRFLPSPHGPSRDSKDSGDPLLTALSLS